MGAWAARAVPIIFLLSSAGAAVGFHEEAPLRLVETISGAGWSSARFVPGSTNVTIAIFGDPQGRALHQITLFDDLDRPIGTFYALKDEMAAYVGITAASVHEDVRLDYPFVGGGSSAGGGGGMPCSAWYGSSWSSTGEKGTSIEVPSTCNGRAVRGFIASSLGAEQSYSRFELRSWDPMAVVSSSAAKEGVFVSVSEMGGTAVDISPAGMMPVGSSIGIGNGSTSTLVSQGLHGAFVTPRSIAPVLTPDLTFSQDDGSGSCPCVWTGGGTTRGEWTFRISGTWSDPIFLGYVDAALPPVS